jgi:cobalt/nickel transport system permease protein
LINTVVASLGFILEFAIGGDPAFALGEGIITALTVTAVAAARPDLVYLLRGTARPLVLKEAS